MPCCIGQCLRFERIKTIRPYVVLQRVTNECLNVQRSVYKPWWPASRWKSGGVLARPHRWAQKTRWLTGCQPVVGWRSTSVTLTTGTITTNNERTSPLLLRGAFWNSAFVLNMWIDITSVQCLSPIAFSGNVRITAFNNQHDFRIGLGKQPGKVQIPVRGGSPMAHSNGPVHRGVIRWQPPPAYKWSAGEWMWMEDPQLEWTRADLPNRSIFCMLNSVNPDGAAL